MPQQEHTFRDLSVFFSRFQGPRPRFIPGGGRQKKKLLLEGASGAKRAASFLIKRRFDAST